MKDPGIFKGICDFSPGSLHAKGEIGFSEEGLKPGVVTRMDNRAKGPMGALWPAQSPGVSQWLVVSLGEKWECITFLLPLL